MIEPVKASHAPEHEGEDLENQYAEDGGLLHQRPEVIQPHAAGEDSRVANQEVARRVLLQVVGLDDRMTGDRLLNRPDHLLLAPLANVAGIAGPRRHPLRHQQAPGPHRRGDQGQAPIEHEQDQGTDDAVETGNEAPGDGHRQRILHRREIVRESRHDLADPAGREVAGRQALQLREQLESNVAGDLALEVRVQLTATQRRGGGDQRARDQDEEYPDEQAAIARLEGIVDQRAEAERNDPVEDGLDRAGRQDYRTHGAARPAVLPDPFEQLQRRQAAGVVWQRPGRLDHRCVSLRY